MMPHTCHVERLFRGGFARVAGSPARTISDTLETQPATCLILAIISSTAFSAGHLSLAMRLMALAHTFSLLRIVNLLFFAFSKITPTFTAERYCIGLPSGFAGKPEVAISSL